MTGTIQKVEIGLWGVLGIVHTRNNRKFCAKKAQWAVQQLFIVLFAVYRLNTLRKFLAWSVDTKWDKGTETQGQDKSHSDGIGT